MSDHVLNLDELFGKARPVKVVYEGIAYELVRPESLNPQQYQELVNLYNKWVKERLDQGTDAIKIDQAMTEIITVLNPKLAEKNLPFSWKSQVLEFYGNETLQSSASKGSSGTQSADPSRKIGSGVQSAEKKPTGA